MSFVEFLDRNSEGTFVITAGSLFFAFIVTLVLVGGAWSSRDQNSAQLAAHAALASRLEAFETCVGVGNAVLECKAVTGL